MSFSTGCRKCEKCGKMYLMSLFDEGLCAECEKAEQEPSGDAISRTEVRKFVEYIQSIKDNHNENRTPINYGTICDIVIKGWNLLKLPSVNPQEPKTGHWIKGMSWECDQCHYEDDRALGTPFCPYCGCRMEK